MFITKDSIEEKMLDIQAKKEELISGAFSLPPEERRRQRVEEIINIFSLQVVDHHGTEKRVQVANLVHNSRYLKNDGTGLWRYRPPVPPGRIGGGRR